MLVERSRSGVGDRKTNEFNLRGSKHTLFQVDGEALEVEEVKHAGEVQLMICHGTQED